MPSVKQEAPSLQGGEHVTYTRVTETYTRIGGRIIEVVATGIGIN